MRVYVIKNVVFILVIQFLLSACSVFSPIKTEQTNTYVISARPQPVTKKPTHRMTLMITQPAVSQINNTTQMVYTARPYQVAYFSKSSWAATPAQMLQSLLMQTLQDTHYFYAVGVPLTVGHYDYALNTQLLQFKQRFFARSSEIILVLQAQIIRAGTNQVIAAKQFTVVQLARENTPYGGVVAANQATAKILSQVAQFCLYHL